MGKVAAARFDEALVLLKNREDVEEAEGLIHVKE